MKISKEELKKLIKEEYVHYLKEVKKGAAGGEITKEFNPKDVEKVVKKSRKKETKKEEMESLKKNLSDLIKTKDKTPEQKKEIRDIQDKLVDLTAELRDEEDDEPVVTEQEPEIKDVGKQRISPLAGIKAPSQSSTGGPQFATKQSGQEMKSGSIEEPIPLTKRKEPEMPSKKVEIDPSIEEPLSAENDMFAKKVLRGNVKTALKSLETMNANVKHGIFDFDEDLIKSSEMMKERKVADILNNTMKVTKMPVELDIRTLLENPEETFKSIYSQLTQFVLDKSKDVLKESFDGMEDEEEKIEETFHFGHDPEDRLKKHKEKEMKKMKKEKPLPPLDLPEEDMQKIKMSGANIPAKKKI